MSSPSPLRDSGKHLPAWPLLWSALFIVGCGPYRPKDMPQLFPCRVTVVDGSAPITDATVVLFTERGMPNLSVNGKTGSNGVAAIRTTRVGARYSEAGAPAGRYLVSVEKRPRWGGEKTNEERSAMTYEEADAYWVKVEKAMATLPREVPAVLSESKRQPLEVIEEKGGALTIDVSRFR